MKTILKMLVIAIFVLLPACDKTKKIGQVPEVKTSEIKGVTSYSAYVTGEILSEGDGTVTERGICWSKNPAPKITDSKMKIGGSESSFAGTIGGLSESTDYYVSAYATNSEGTAYGVPAQVTTEPTISDTEGNKYSTVKIGAQTWMAENLKTTKFSSGESIPYVTSNWGSLTSSACCSYSNDLNISAEYGKFYNWYAASDSRNVCPAGWHVPSDAEWMTLINYLGGFDAADPKLREGGIRHWTEANAGPYNSSGFTAFGAGKREADLSHDMTAWTFFWTSTPTEGFQDRAVVYIVDVYLAAMRSNMLKADGFSVRCLKD